MKLKLYNVENINNNSLGRPLSIQRSDSEDVFLSKASGIDPSWFHSLPYVEIFRTGKPEYAPKALMYKKIVHQLQAVPQ